MVMKDTSVIIDNEDYEGDVLENVDLQSNFRQRMKLKKQQEAKTGIPSNGFQSKNILPQYDEEDEDITAKKQNRILLQSTDNDGVSGMTKEQRLEELREKLSNKYKQKVSLDVTKNIGSDYATVISPDDHSNESYQSTAVGNGQILGGFKKFAKPSILKKRQAEQDIVTLLEQESDQRQGGQQIESGLGTREQKQRELESDRKLQEQAEETKLRNFQNATTMNKRVKYDQRDEFEDDEYSQIQNQLEKQRMKQQKDKQQHKGEDFIQNLIQKQQQSTANQDQQMTDISQVQDEEVELITSKPELRGDNVQDITSISKDIPVNNIPTQDQLRQNGMQSQLNNGAMTMGIQSLSLAKTGFTSVVNVTLPSQRIQELARLNQQRNPYEKAAEEEEKTKSLEGQSLTEKEEIKDEIIQQLEERLCGKGLGNALQIFRDRGMLGKNFFFGRNKDQNTEQILKSFGKDGSQEDDRVRLVHVDKRGRALTQKEAFRQMCWKFHGKMPSHKKQEKRKNKEDLESKINSISIGLNPQAKVPSAAKKLGNLGNLGSLGAKKKPKKI
eukprot:403363156